MKKIKVGINGLGRIGRTVLREYFNRNLSDIEIIASFSNSKFPGI